LQWRLRAVRALLSAVVRWLVLCVVIFAVGCGGSSEPRTNRLRPAPPVTLTGAIHDDGIQISPAAVGAGQIILLLSNQSGRPQTVTIETASVTSSPGHRASSPTIRDGATGRVTLNATRGAYTVHVRDSSIRAARILVGPPRKSGQNDLLLP
jgi:hypothetical protein